MADAFSFVPFKREDHIYHNEAFAELCKDAVRAFNGTPVCELPPPRFTGSGVYAIYCTAKKGIYERYGNKVNRMGYNVPIYVGKAVPAGARKGGFGLGTDPGLALYNRLREHADSVNEAKNLELRDFSCRFLAVDDIWIPLAESLLIERFSPLWNRVLDGFGNHDPGKGRYNQQKSPWDTLHPGRNWAERLQPNAANSQETLTMQIKAFVSEHCG